MKRISFKTNRSQVIFSVWFGPNPTWIIQGPGEANLSLDKSKELTQIVTTRFETVNRFGHFNQWVA